MRPGPQACQPDLIEGKRTVLVALALDAVSPAERAVLDGALGRPLSVEQVEEVRRIITGSGADAQVEAVIDELSRLALSALARAEISEEARGALADLAAAATRRTT